MPGKIFVVTGRLGKNLVVSKVLPLVELRVFSRIIIFSEEAGFNISGAEYITLPVIIRKCRIKFFGKIIRILYELFQLIYYAIRLKPDYINGIYTNPKGINGMIASAVTGCKCIISVIGGQPEIESSFFNKRMSVSFNIFMLKRCHMIFTKGQNDNRYLEGKGIFSSKLQIYNGAIDTSKFYYDNTLKDIDVVFVGYFDLNKGPDRFVDICSLLTRKRQYLKAYMLGDGPLYKKVIGKIKAMGMTDYITAIGRTDNVAEFLRMAKVMILPSCSEGLSTAMLEAMACGCVPIVTDVGNNSEAAIDGANSFLVSSCHNIEAFARLANNLLTDRVLWEELSIGARKTISSKYTPSTQAEKIRKIFE